MSRTFKDKPYWVKTNEDHKNRVTFHNHKSFGEPIYKRVRILDAKGNPVKETVTESYPSSYRVVYNNGTSVIYSRLQWTVAQRSLNTVHVRRVDTLMHTYTRTITKMEQVVIGYVADHCTADHLINKQDPNEHFYPCSHYIANHTESMFKGDRQLRQRQARAKERDSMKTLTKKVNCGEDYDQEWNRAVTRTYRHSWND